VVEMSDDKKIDVNDINYAVYKLGNWKNDYEINQIGLSKEINDVNNQINEGLTKHVFNVGDDDKLLILSLSSFQIINIDSKNN